MGGVPGGVYCAADQHAISDGQALYIRVAQWGSLRVYGSFMETFLFYAQIYRGRLQTNFLVPRRVALNVYGQRQAGDMTRYRGADMNRQRGGFSAQSLRADSQER